MTAALPFAPHFDSRYPQVELLIDGEWTRDTNAPLRPIVNPATGAAIGELPCASAADLDRAVAAAKRAFDKWRDVSPDERARIMTKAAQLLRERADRIAAILTLEQGKPLAEAKGELARASLLIDWDANEGRRAYGRIIPGEAGTRQLVLRQPIGPVAAFTPWNFPAGGPARKIGAALAAGCSIVLKGAEETPATLCAFAQCFLDAGLPPGVLNLVFGDAAAISRHLISAPEIRLVTLTGSVAVGKQLAQLAAAHMKPCVMELGGHAPVIVCEDADPVVAATQSARFKFRNAGQICISPTRFLVHQAVYDRFVEAFVHVASTLKVGDGFADKVDMGPLAHARRLTAMESFVADAIEKGAQLKAGGRRIEREGFFFEPTVLGEVPANARLMSEEPFGPVVPINRFSDLDDAIAEANRLPYGLASYAFTQSARSAALLADRVESGVMQINSMTGNAPETPFGGVKESGYGREGGEESLHSYLVTKFVSHVWK